MKGQEKGGEYYEKVEKIYGTCTVAYHDDALTWWLRRK